MSNDWRNEYWKLQGGKLQYDVYQRQKMAIIKKMIPEGVRTVLDVGCGDGSITNTLFDDGYDVTALDISSEALKYVSDGIKRLCCDAVNIPVADSYFDVVVTNEMLEHIPESSYHQVLNEISRVARDHIIISIPYQEKLTMRTLRCSECGKRYNKTGHLRAYTDDSLDLFDHFRNAVKISCGPLDMPSSEWLNRVRIALNCSVKPNEARPCPHCGQVSRSRYNRYLGFAAHQLQKGINMIARPVPSPYWAVIRYDRKIEDKTCD